jgi:7-carboxy-7-deazaguanine synthase
MSKFDPTKLKISSDFYSVQGEGISSGIPSYFIRLGVCNLECGMSRAFANKLAKEQTLEDGEIFKGDLEIQGKASWTCDSTSQWLWRGVDKDFQYLIDQWKEQGIYDDIINGTIHLIWTGGEPTIKQHQEAIVNFFKYWAPIILKESMVIKQISEKEVYVDLSALSKVRGFNEIETNGTIYIQDDLFRILHQINCSPKLSNSGMNEKRRIVPEAIKRIMEHPNYQFKFVISNEEDVEEMFRDFIKPFDIPLKNVVCMPGLDAQTDFHERTQFVLEMGKKYRFRALTRLHISAWDKTLNV